MRRYRFRLERLLAIRRYHEREWELRLGAATARVLQTRRGIADARDGIARSFEATGALDPLVVIATERYRQGLAARIVTLEAELERREAELAKVRAGYLEASRKRKVLDKLRERQADTWRREQGRQEIAVLNEIATAQTSRTEVRSGDGGWTAADEVFGGRG